MDTRTLCLGALSAGPLSGYEIHKLFEEGPYAHFQDTSFGSIYPTLKRLAEEDLVKVEALEQESRPDKKLYRITPHGRRALFDALSGPVGPDRLRSDFLFVLCFAELLDPSDLDRMVEQRVAHHRSVLDRLTSGDCADGPHHGSGCDIARRYGIAMHSAALRFMEAHRHEIVGRGLVEPA